MIKRWPLILTLLACASFPLHAAKHGRAHQGEGGTQGGAGWVVFDEIGKHQAEYDNLEHDFEATLKKMLSTEAMSADQEHNYSQLSIADEMVRSMNREFSVLNMVWTLSSLVTEKKNVKYARSFVERQLDKMARKAADDGAFITRKMSGGQDLETNRLLLRSQNQFRTSADLLTRIKSDGRPDAALPIPITPVSALPNP